MFKKIWGNIGNWTNGILGVSSGGTGSGTVSGALSSLGLTDASIYKGTIACAGNPNYPAGTKSDFYIVSTAGKIGGASGRIVGIGDIIFCNTTAATGDQATVGASWNVFTGVSNNTSYFLITE